jgi:hypothetical protein
MANNHRFGALAMALAMSMTVLPTQVLALDTSTASPSSVVTLVDTDGTSTTQPEQLSLMDLDVVSSMTSVGWGSLRLNKNPDNGTIELLVDGTATQFEKGIGAHATSSVVYDLTGYDYDWFEAYAGVSSSKGSNGNGVKFYVYTSQDGKEWECISGSGTAIKGSSDAEFIKAYIKGAKYLKLYAGDNGSDYYDHACWADPILRKSTAAESAVSVSLKTVAQYDQEIKAQYPNVDSHLLHQRDFVNSVGYGALNNFVRQSEANAAAISWLMDDQAALSYFTLGGSPEGTYLGALKQLSRLYAEYSSDMDNDLYLRMLIALSLSHASPTALWANTSSACNVSDPVTRYEIYKRMYNEGKLFTETFEDNNIEEMRWVMNSIIDDESIEWLRDWTDAKRQAGVSGYLNPYTYVKYQNYNYSLSQYHDEENYAEWDAKYGLSKYGITYGAPIKTWIVFEQGGVCGAISKVGTTIRNSYGQPASCVSQPGHCAYIYLEYNNGNRYWSLGNDVSGWAYSGTTERLNLRMMCDWGYRSDFSWMHPMTYIFLAQEAINDWDSYAEAETILMLADVYDGDEDTQEEIYESALSVEGINYDAWYNLVKMYIAQNRSDAELLNLAQRIMSTYKYHPMPMNDLVTLLTNAMSSNGAKATANTLRVNALKNATSTSSANSLQWQGVRAEANRLLGEEETAMATFSFIGDEANVLKLNSRFDGTDVDWEYSLDGTNWIQVADNGQVTLNPDDITLEQGIRIHLVGTDYSDNNIYKISITKGASLDSLYANNWEGRLMDAGDTVEYRVDGEDTWQPYTSETRRFGVDKTETVYFRTAADTLRRAGDIRTVTFTAHDTSVGEYLTIDHMTAELWPVTDGKIYSYCTFKTSAVLELDKLYYVTGGWYVSDQANGYGRVKELSAYASEDGENWTLIMDKRTLENSSEPQAFQFDVATNAKYIKYEANSVYSGLARAEMLMVAYAGEASYEDIVLTSDNQDKVGYNGGSVLNFALDTRVDNVIYRVREIGDNAFYQNEALTSVKLPDGVTKIGASAFAANWNLKSIKLPDSITEIGDGAFLYCDSLETIQLPGGLTEISDFLFFGCDSLTSVTIPASVTKIGDSAFADCENLTDIYFSGSRAQWDEIDMGDYNDILKNVTIHYDNDFDYSGSLASFDGDTIVLDSRFDGYNATWSYSLDGGSTWTVQNGENRAVLDEAELESLTVEDGIVVRVYGYDYVIDLTRAAAPTGLTTDDTENRVYGWSSEDEWSTDGKTWTLFDEENPRFEGDVKVFVRTARPGGTVLASEPVAFRFTAGSDTDTRKHISIEDLSVYSVSSVSTKNYAQNANDLNTSTYWVAKNTDSERAFVYELNSVRAVSGVTIVGCSGFYYNPDSVTVYTSMDGETWEKAISSSLPWNNGQATTALSFDAVEAQYVKFQFSANPLMGYAGAAILSVYEDITQ